MQPTPTLLALLLAAPVLSGEPAVKNPPPSSLTAKPDTGWEITATPYGWAAGIDGTMGVRGYTAGVDVGFKDILENLDMAAMINLEARKGRFGAWVDGLYLKVSTDAQTPGPLLESLGVGIEQIIAETAVFWRVWEGERGYLDLYAGARYMQISGDLSFRISDSGITNLSERLGEEIIDQVTDAVRSQAASTLQSKKAQLATAVTERIQDRVADATNRIADARNQARESLALRVSAKAQEARASIAQLQAISAAHPKLDDLIRNSARLQNAIRSVATARIDQQIATAQQEVAAAELELDQARQSVQSRVQAAIARAEQRLANARAAAHRAEQRARRAVARAEERLATAIEEALRDAIPSEVSQSLDWVDPFIGLRAHHQFTERLYGLVKADIGGFGISSDLTWQVYGALGWKLTEDVAVEFGYRHLAVDYTRGGFVFDAGISGAVLAMSVRF